MNDLIKTSRFLSSILRHKPESVGITLDEHGWTNVSELIEGIKKQQPFTMEELETIVETDEKQRYSFNEEKNTNSGKSGAFHSR